MCERASHGPDGDLRMGLPLNRTFKSPGLLVNKHTPRLGSPVFGTMLAVNSAFLDNTMDEDGVQVLHFPDSHFDLMEITMKVFHLRGHEIPQAVSFEILYQLAVLCDKYDLGRGLGPWGERWSQQYIKCLASTVTERMLFV